MLDAWSEKPSTSSIRNVISFAMLAVVEKIPSMPFKLTFARRSVLGLAHEKLQISFLFFDRSFQQHVHLAFTMDEMIIASICCVMSSVSVPILCLSFFGRFHASGFFWSLAAYRWIPAPTPKASQVSPVTVHYSAGDQPFAFYCNPVRLSLAGTYLSSVNASVFVFAV